MPGKEDTYVLRDTGQETKPLSKSQLPLGLVGGAKGRYKT